MKIVLLIFLSGSLTENNKSNSIKTTRHETSTEVLSTTNGQIATITSIGSTSAMATTEEALIPKIKKITMQSIQIVVFKATIN